MKMLAEEAQAREEQVERPSPPKKETPQMVRRASFSEAEAFFLHQLFVDDNSSSNVASNTATATAEPAQETTKALTDEMLFSVPPKMTVNDASSRPKLPPSHQKARRRSTVDLWKAHADGITPAILKRKGSLVRKSSTFNDNDGEARRDSELLQAPDETQDGDEDASDAASDVEVRPEKEMDDVSVASSWDEEEEHDFDTWEVLKDEYAADFGFDYDANKVSMDSIIDDEEVGNTFRILGTSADDVSCMPHVLSPPLMDALTNFLPTDIQGENFWMRYSLVRDGASLETMKQYVRAATYTIMAIETRNGEVFGSFTSSAWRTNLGFFGSMPSFVWKMRHSRRSKCTSLFEQAQLESEIDVFMCQNQNQFVQMCRHDAMAVGGDDGAEPIDEFNVPAAMEDVETGGFAIALEEDLMCGTTSPSKTFKSPALYGSGAKTAVFDVAGLEIWSFTPCLDVKSAEKLEMTKYFIEESMRGSSHSVESDRSFGSRDLIQEKFYRRVGDDLESEERRQRWQYANMMNPSDGTSRGLGATPRFVN